ncbi:MAG: hypothetical protein NZ700_16295 [Gemmataceae bacterium]|nr:hypothetical protein [Gemmataceae bacterium]MDW8265668.1 hypothetical protein [Gemmataceae bacterium]
MAPSHPFGWTNLLGWLLVVAAATASRAWYLLRFTDAGLAEPPPVQVQDPSPRLALPPGTRMHGQDPPTELDALIHNLKEHRWFGSLPPFAAGEERTAHTSPGYPWLRARLELLAEPLLGETVSVDQVQRWLHVALGALTAGFCFLLAQRMFRHTLVGVLSGLAAAVYPFWILNTAELNDGVWATFLLMAVVWLGCRGAAEGGAVTSLVFGFSLAALALVRAPLLPFAVVALLWYLAQARHVPRGWLAAILAFLGFVNGLGYWVVRNYQAFGDFVPVVDSAYYHLWVGNNSHAHGGPVSEDSLMAVLTEVKAADFPDASREEIRRWVQLQTRAERVRLYGEMFWSELRQHPGAFWRRRLEAAAAFLLGRQWALDGKLWRGDFAATEPVWWRECFAGCLYASVFGLLALGLLGWRWSYPWRAEAMPATLALVWLPLPYVLSHAEMLSGPRLPWDGVLLCHAAFALAAMLPGIGPPSRSDPEDHPGN